MFVFSCSCLVVRSHEVKDERYEIDQDSMARSWLMFVAVMAATLALSGEAMQVVLFNVLSHDASVKSVRILLYVKMFEVDPFDRTRIILSFEV
ncbi:hypothetical protein Tco_0210209 [Tanacetum coccineum]